MVEPSTILAAVVDLLADIPGVLSLVDGDANNIYAHTPAFPDSASLEVALSAMQVPSILVAYEGGQTGVDTIAWTHTVSIFVVPNGAVLSLLSAIVDGIPTGQAYKFQDLEILSTLDCAHELSILPPQARDFGEVTFDLWSVRLSYREKRN